MPAKAAGSLWWPHEGNCIITASQFIVGHPRKDGELMSVTFYGLKTCDTCRKALKELAAANIQTNVRDVRSDGVPPELVTSLLATHGDTVVINRKSTTWRGLDEAERNGDPVALLATHPTLLKRPVILAEDGSSHIGWNGDVKVALGITE